MVDRNDNIIKSFVNSDDILEKAKRANIGEVREWKGGKYRKTYDGWVLVTDNKTKVAKMDGEVDSIDIDSISKIKLSKRDQAAGLANELNKNTKFQNVKEKLKNSGEFENTINNIVASNKSEIAAQELFKIGLKLPEIINITGIPVKAAIDYCKNIARSGLDSLASDSSQIEVNISTNAKLYNLEKIKDSNLFDANVGDIVEFDNQLHTVTNKVNNRSVELLKVINGRYSLVEVHDNKNASVYKNIDSRSELKESKTFAELVGKMILSKNYHFLNLFPGSRLDSNTGILTAYNGMECSYHIDNFEDDDYEVILEVDGKKYTAEFHDQILVQNVELINKTIFKLFENKKL